MSDPVPQPSEAPYEPPRRRRRWPWVVVAVLVLIGILVALTPQIMSLSFMREYLLSRINRNLKGKLQIEDWSLGWKSCEFRNLRLFDEKQSEVFSVARIRANLSFRNLVHGRYNCGETELEEPNFTQLIVGSDGKINLQEVFPAQGRKRRGARAEPVELSGDFNITRLRATIVDRRNGSTQIIEPSTAHVSIRSQKVPIQYAVALKTRDATTQLSEKKGRRRVTPDVAAALASTSEGKVPFEALILAGADGMLRAVGRPIITASTRPTTAPATTQPAPARHRHRSG